MERDEIDLSQLGPGPWDLRPGESSKLYGRFNEFLLMGSRRSVYAVYLAEYLEKRGLDGKARGSAQKRARPSLPRSWKAAAEQWEWSTRADAWDHAMRLRSQQKWEDRRDELRSLEWKTAQALIAKAQNMLEYPLATTSREERGGEDGKIIAVTTVIPARWGMGDAGRLLDTASKLGRLAAGMATNIEERRDKPAEEMSDDELAAIAARGRTSNTDESDTGASGTGIAETAAST